VNTPFLPCIEHPPDEVVAAKPTSSSDEATDLSLDICGPSASHCYHRTPKPIKQSHHLPVSLIKKTTVNYYKPESAESLLPELCSQ
jgi:hypothetical protein